MLKKIIELILPKKFYYLILIIYQSIKYKSYKYLFYKVNIDKEINEKKLIDISIDKEKIISNLKILI